VAGEADRELLARRAGRVGHLHRRSTAAYTAGSSTTHVGVDKGTDGILFEENGSRRSNAGGERRRADRPTVCIEAIKPSASASFTF
jgi:hypothetical protein